ncbi:MAG: GNAT family N-acetyltransferase [Anaerosomatales bacterium]|nr:GNAT family N-acetyltransferase [Anaerosomatales bacterium]
MNGAGSSDGRRAGELVPLAIDDIPRAVELMSRAFEDDPFVDWVVRSDAKHDEGMHRFFEVCLRQLTVPYGEVWTTDDFGGVAMWTPPARFSVGIGEQLRFIGQAIRGMQMRHVPSRLAAFTEIERHHPQEPHYYLFFLGVDPERQGEGIGSRMMASVLARCDTQRMPAYLEATRPDLVPFYERFGYRPLEPFRIPYGGPPLYPMLRQPRLDAGCRQAPGSIEEGTYVVNT